MKKSIKALFIIGIGVLALSTGCSKKASENNTTQKHDKYYEISYLNYDGSLISSEMVKEGEMPNGLATTPVKEAILGYYYDFIGWGPELIKADGDKNYIAQYSDLLMKDEMNNFVFESTNTECVISGVKDTSVDKIIVPEYVTEIEGGAFTGCSSLTYLELPFSGNKLYSEEATDLHPVGYLFGTESYDNSYSASQHDSLHSPYVSYYIPRSLKEVSVNGEFITYGAFIEFYGVETFHLSKSIKETDDYALEKLADNVSIYYDGTIEDWINIKSNTKDAMIGADHVDFYLLDNNGDTEKFGKKYSLLTYLEIPNTITCIPGYRFRHFYCIDRISINSESLLEIGNMAFAECDFNGNIYAKNLKTIGEYAFMYNSEIDSFYLGNSIESIGAGAFINVMCDFTWGDNPTLTKIDDYAFDRYAGEDFYIPDCVEEIGEYAFCDAMCSIAFGKNSSLKTINDNAFYRYDYNSFIIPKNVELIGKNAFYNCIRLYRVYYNGTATDWSKIEISEGNTYLTNATIYYYSETQPTGFGNYWHYDNDGKTIIEW